jgi:hypothetical protein
MINSNDLSTLFASTRRDAQGLLPHLVRRLILATCSDRDLARIEMAAGDDIRLHGWDGSLLYNSTHPYIPTGTSAWEMGVSSNPQSKANEDYTKRSRDPLGLNPALSTFVFVTPHVWNGRNDWIDTKQAEQAWADVRVIDGSMLVLWLERAPAVALWIAERLGRSIQGVQTVDRYWDSSIVTQYSPAITPELIIGGRVSTYERLADFLRDPTGLVSLLGETLEESIMFATATCKQITTEAAHAEDASRLLVISDHTASEHLATLSEDHIAILTDPSLRATFQTDAHKHLHLIIPEQRDARTSQSAVAIELDTLVRSAISNSLVDIGRSEVEANRIAGESKGSLHALLWLLAEPERGALECATGQPASELAPLVLAGQWTINEHEDHEVIALLAQREYNEVKQTLIEWSGASKPLTKRGAIWDWKAWRFAWSRLAPSLERDDIHRFLKIAEQVLGAADPALELPLEERWLAAIRGKVHKYSPALREGLAQSLVLLAMHNDAFQDVDSQAEVDGFIASFLRADNLAQRWISISRWLPDLAEAAPDTFLNALDNLVTNQEAINELFTEGGMLGSSPHTHVLWALERLAWSEDHFARVVLALGRLADVDPGGNLHNRPSNSLREILLPMSTPTGAPIEDRISAVRLLFVQFNDVGWQCATSLLPRFGELNIIPSRPQWREWSTDTNKHITVQDYWSFQEHLIELMLEHTGLDGERWKTLLEASPELRKDHPELGNRVLDALRAIDTSEFSRENAFVLGDAARALVMRHENGSHTDWAMKEESLAVYRELCEHLRPQDLRYQHRWLFTQWPEILRDLELTEEERTDRLTTLRVQATNTVLAEHGFLAVLEWTDDVEFPEALGSTLAALDLTDEQVQQLLRTGLLDPGTPQNRPPVARLVFGYVETKVRAADEAWRDQTLKSISDTLGPQSSTLFLLALPRQQDTWQLVERLDEHIQTAYWSSVWFNLLNLEDCEIVVPKLLAANRPFKAIDIVGMLLHRDRRGEWNEQQKSRAIALARTVLDAEIDHGPSDEHGMSSSPGFWIDDLLAFLESNNIPRQELAGWEWRWLPFIERESRRIKALQAEIADDPALFIELLGALYKPENQDDEHQNEDLEPQEEHRASAAYKLLEAWTRLPGLDEDARRLKRNEIKDELAPITPAWIGSVDEDSLTAWVERAIELATESHHLSVCLNHIGRVFAYAPAEKDGVWPCIAVRRIIEQHRSDDLEQGMRTGVLNRRGVYFATRDGRDETAMANQLRRWCESVRAEYPRTGTLLRLLAEDYESEAQRRVREGKIEEYND